MKEFIEQHPWLTGFLLFVLVFILNTIRRLIATKKRMPREKKLEHAMRRATMALRKLGRAKRLLHRFIAVRNAAPRQPMPGMIRRLWMASSDAADAVTHLSAVLKKATGLGCSVSVMQNLDYYIGMAQSIREECRRRVRSPGISNSSVTLFTQEQMPSVAHDCIQDLAQANGIVDKWIQETEQGEVEIARTVDPVIYRSRGMFRNPFKPENLVEGGQTESVFLLRLTREDINRVQQCISMTQMAVEALKYMDDYEVYQIAELVGRALDSIDVALADAKLPLPAGLAIGESPYDSPNDREQSGILQRIYARLTTVEASMYRVQRKES
jgi:hypothetical protein